MEATYSWFGIPPLVLGCFAAYFLYKFMTSVTSSAKYPPGPHGISALLTILKAFSNGDLHKQARKWPGELVLCRTPFGNFCFLNSARVVKELFASKEREPLTNDRPRMFSGWFLTDYKDVAFSDTTVNLDWPRHRRLFHHAIRFYGEGVDRFESIVQTELQHLVSGIETKAGQDIDAYNLLSYSVLSVLVILFTGSCPEPESESVRIMKDADDALNELIVSGTESILSAFPFLRFVPGTRFYQICQKVKIVRDRFYAEFFTKCKASFNPGQQGGIINFLLDEQEKKENQWLQDDNIKGLALNMLAGGYSTSFATLKALLLFLVHNPEVMHRVQKEVDDVIGSRVPAVADKRSLPYTEAVVMETIRLSSVVPLGVPHQTREDVVIDGYTIPKGTRVFANAWTYLRDPEVYDDPEVFRPERFLDDARGELLPSSHPVRQSLLAFGIGKRSCPGENFARTRIFLYITTLLQKFDILPPKEHQLQSADPETYRDGLVLRPLPYHLIFQRRSS